MFIAAARRQEELQNKWCVNLPTVDRSPDSGRGCKCTSLSTETKVRISKLCEGLRIHVTCLERVFTASVSSQYQILLTTSQFRMDSFCQARLRKGRLCTHLVPDWTPLDCSVDTDRRTTTSAQRSHNDGMSPSPEDRRRTEGQIQHLIMMAMCSGSSHTTLGNEHCG